MLLEAFIFILAIVFVLTVPLIPTSTNYGTWETKEGECIPNTLDVCPTSGKKTVVRRCIPNPNTGWGCKEGRQQTFDTFVTQEDCQAPCVLSRWETSPGPDGTIKYVCVPQNTTGVNLCTRLTREGIVTYKPHETYISSVFIP